MNKTKELLLKIRAAVVSGRLPAENVPIGDIKESVRFEIELHRNTVTYGRYRSIQESFQRLCADIPEQERDVSKTIMLLDTMILCIDMLSDVIYTLANRAYWEYKHPDKLDHPEVQEIISYIEKNHKINLLNYNFVDEYETLPVSVCFDEACRMPYVPYKGRRMFFPENWDENRIVQYYRSLAAEQDSRSPHCYRHSGYDVEKGDVVVDVGAAEGIFTLDIIDTAQKVYLIEADGEWMEALQQTFREDGEKVRIIYGFADSVTEGDRLTLDALLTEEIHYIKMDIEGSEKAALQGADRLFRECGRLKCAICSYHCREDEEWIRNFLQMRNFDTDVSDGFMCPDWTVEAYLEAELRRGIVFGKKRMKE